jgi:hypothetical protein
VIVTESATEVFATVTENVAVPPGSGSEVGVADFVTVIELGVSRSLFVTVHVFVSPSAIEPVQSLESDAA